MVKINIAEIKRKREREISSGRVKIYIFFSSTGLVLLVPKYHYTSKFYY
jgi:hypothetical protein